MDEQPIYVIKKKVSHGGHHGGAWKVAYADFVTAMMALFIVLWLMSCTSKQTQQEIAGYFNDPKGTASKKGSEGKPAVREAKNKKDDMENLRRQLLRAIADVDVLNKLLNQIEITVTDEGLRIELIEDERGTFFELGSAQPTPALREILGVLAGELKHLPNKVSIEGHTDAHPYEIDTAYGNWELSTDRANVARRELEREGVRANQVSQVRGFADQQLHLPLRPLDPANRRVSLVVQNLPPAPASKELPKAKPGEERAAVPVAEAPKPVALAQGSAQPRPGLMERARGMFRR